MKVKVIVFALLTASSLSQALTQSAGPKQVMGIRYSTYFCKSTDGSIILTPERLIILNGLKSLSGEKIAKAGIEDGFVQSQVVDPIINIPNLTKEELAASPNESSEQTFKFGGEGYPEIRLSMRAKMSKALKTVSAYGVCESRVPQPHWGTSAMHEVSKFSLTGTISGVFKVNLPASLECTKVEGFTANGCSVE